MAPVDGFRGEHSFSAVVALHPYTLRSLNIRHIGCGCGCAGSGKGADGADGANRNRGWDEGYHTMVIRNIIEE